jgi:hypothetical protein
MGLFAMLVVAIFEFALPDGASERSRALAPALLWITYVFAALLGLGRAFALELENDALSALALAPADRGWVFLGKADRESADPRQRAGARRRWCSRCSSTSTGGPVALPLAGVSRSARSGCAARARCSARSRCARGSAR